MLKIRKGDSNEYMFKMLYSLVCCFKRYIKDNNVYDINPFYPSTHDSIARTCLIVQKLGILKCLGIDSAHFGVL